MSQLRFVFFLLTLAWATLCSAAPSVALFYGKAAPLDELKAFDIVVVEPGHGFDPRRARHPDSQLFAYVGIGEAHPGRAWFADIPPAAKLTENSAWGSVVVDLSHPDWPGFVADRIVAPLWEKGYRGFFLDTLDSYRLAKGFDEAAQQKGLITVIETLHRRFPGIRLILNRGFEVVPAVRDKITMVAAESLFQGWDAKNRRYTEVPANDREWLLGQLVKVRDEYKIPVLAIDYVPPADRALTRQTAERISALGIVPWVTDNALESLGIGAVEVMPRKVLVLYDSRESPAVNYSNAHRFVEMPLNHLGYVVEHHDVNQALTEYPMSGRIAGVVVWLSGSPPKPRLLAEWLKKRMGEGIRIAFIGQFGIPLDIPASRRMGLNLLAQPEPGKIEIAAQHAMFGFEATTQADRRNLLPIRLAGAGTPLLELADTQGKRYHAAALTPWGGFVLDPYVIQEVPGTEQVRWLINPFAFLTGALQLSPLPVPDLTTENGRRLLLVHIDGDGFPSRAELPGSPLAGRVLLDEIFKRYRIPHSMSVIEAEIATHGLYPKDGKEMEEISRQMFALPHIEVASHTYSHPYRWDNSVKHGLFKNAAANVSYHLPVPGYQLNLQREITGAMAYIQKLAPGKPARLLHWTGDTAPGIDALRITAEAGFLNINGGDTTITRSNPSLTNVAAIGIEKGGYRQIYAPIANENLFTNLWRGPFYGFKRIIETFEMTDKPRRLKPIGIYYHTYSATKRASLDALHTVYTWALAQENHPVYPSEYVKKALDFYSMTIARSGNGWLVRGQGELRTLRTPASLGLPDPATSTGLAGYRPGAEGNYLHLVGRTAQIVFSNQAQHRPYLVSANARLVDWQDTKGDLRFTLKGHVPLEFTLGNTGKCNVYADGKPLRPRVSTPASSSFRLDHAAAALRIHCP